MLDRGYDYEGLMRLACAVVAQAAADLAKAIETGAPQYHAALFLETCCSDGSGTRAVKRIRRNHHLRRRIITGWRGLNNCKAQIVRRERELQNRPGV